MGKSSKSFTPPKMIPTLRVDDQDLPAIRDWKVGQTYELSVKVKMISSRQGDEYADVEPKGEPKAKHSAVFRIEEITTDDDTAETPDRPLVAGIKKKALNS